MGNFYPTPAQIPGQNPADVVPKYTESMMHGEISRFLGAVMDDVAVQSLDVEHRIVILETMKRTAEALLPDTRPAESTTPSLSPPPVEEKAE